jgi:hypothetical protein
LAATDKKKQLESSAPAQTTSEDVVIIGGPTSDGAGANVLRLREGRLETGQIRHMQQGKPIVGEVVTLRPRQECPNICDVKVEYAPPAPAPAPVANRPPQVATASYRQNWDDIFRRPAKQLPS